MKSAPLLDLGLAHRRVKYRYGGGQRHGSARAARSAQRSEGERGSRHEIRLTSKHLAGAAGTARSRYSFAAPWQPFAPAVRIAAVLLADGRADARHTRVTSLRVTFFQKPNHSQPPRPPRCSRRRASPAQGTALKST
jgi:hypothetical protein